MSVGNVAFGSTLDPYKQLTIQVTHGTVQIGASDYDKSVRVPLTHDQARELVKHITEQLDRA